MTPEELKEKLRSLGINPDDPAWMKSKAIDLGKLPFIRQQRDSLAKVADLLEAQASSDEAKIAALREQLARIKRGGGK